METTEICKMYENGASMREVALYFNTNHKRISRILNKCGIEIRNMPKLSSLNKFKSKIERDFNNMAKHIRFEVDYLWFLQFEDIEKVKTLNDCITNREDRWEVSTEWYKEYVLKFYYDAQFSKLFSKWKENGCDKYMKPSIDHIVPRASGGTNALNNLQFLTWFENRCKNNMTQEQWDLLKFNIKDYLL